MRHLTDYNLKGFILTLKNTNIINTPYNSVRISLFKCKMMNTTLNIFIISLFKNYYLKSIKKNYS
jgi:hypothetical protein